MGTTDEDLGKSADVRVWPAFVCVVGFATLPYLDLLATNPGEMDLARLAAWWAATVGGAIAVVGVAQRWRAGRRTAVFVALLLYVTFRFRDVAAAQDRLHLGDGSYVLGWVVVALLLFVPAVPLSRRRGLQTFLAVVSVALTVGAGLPLLTGTVAGTSADTMGERAAPSANDEALAATPNIWLLIPDGYSRADVLEARTGLDTQPWLDELRARGFQVADQARANYPTTWASLSSMLEMAYLLREDDRIGDLGPLFDRLRGNNATVEALRGWGYTYVHSGAAVWEGSRCAGYEDVCVAGRSPVTETDWGVLRSTPLAPLLRRSVYEHTAALADPSLVVGRVLADEPEAPYFVLAHLFSPHPPFVRDSACRFRAEVEGLYTPGRPGEYSDMVECLNSQLLTAIDEILAVDDEAVILIQADHGHDWGLNWEDPRDPVWDSAVGDDRWPLLSALRLPDGCEVPSSLAPVNTMRLTLACLRGEEPDLLPYRSWVTTYHPDVVAR